MAGPYLVGNVIRLTAIWVDPNNANAPIDPNTITFKYVDPTGLSTTAIYPAGVIRDGVGVYHLDIPVNVAGTWWYDSIATGAGVSRAENSFVVLASKIP